MTLCLSYITMRLESHGFRCHSTEPPEETWKPQTASLFDQSFSISLVYAVGGPSKLPLSKGGQLVYQCARNFSWFGFHATFEWLNLTQLA